MSFQDMARNMPSKAFKEKNMSLDAFQSLFTLKAEATAKDSEGGSADNIGAKTDEDAEEEDDDTDMDDVN